MNDAQASFVAEGARGLERRHEEEICPKKRHDDCTDGEGSVGAVHPTPAVLFGSGRPLHKPPIAHLFKEQTCKERGGGGGGYNLGYF